jgi:hypothetical protein
MKSKHTVTPQKTVDTYMNYLDTAAQAMTVAFDEYSQHLKYCFPHVFHLGCRNTRVF